MQPKLPQGGRIGNAFLWLNPPVLELYHSCTSVAQLFKGPSGIGGYFFNIFGAPHSSGTPLKQNTTDARRPPSPSNPSNSPNPRRAYFFNAGSTRLHHQTAAVTCCSTSRRAHGFVTVLPPFFGEGTLLWLCTTRFFRRHNPPSAHPLPYALSHLRMRPCHTSLTHGDRLTALPLLRGRAVFVVPR